MGVAPPNGWVEVEFSDLSTSTSEHAVSAIVNTKSDYEGYVYVISESYRPSTLSKH